jgi:REP element-mobilizing transposase RayT
VCCIGTSAAAVASRSQIEFRESQKTAYHLMAEFPHIKSLSGRYMWAGGYFCCSSSNVTDEVIAKYIADQNIDQEEDFRVDG